MILHLDTHVALWMAAGEKRRLRPAASRLRTGSLFVSPIAIVEMEVLREIGRIRQPVGVVLELLRVEHGVETAAGEIREIAARARRLAWTRDPFDRLIVAHALAHGAVLVTADATIRKGYPRAWWGD